MRISAIAAVLLTSVCISWMGCSQEVPGRPQPAPVEGQLMWEGKPVEGATVVFMPEDHQYAAVGRTDSSGQFHLQTFQKNDGAVPGKFKITVRKFEILYPPGGGEIEQQLLPLIYQDPNKGQLTAIIEQIPLNHVLIDLKGSPPPQNKKLVP